MQLLLETSGGVWLSGQVMYISRSDDTRLAQAAEPPHPSVADSAHLWNSCLQVCAGLCLSHNTASFIMNTSESTGTTRAPVGAEL